jgi:DNA-directed RNA polymerase subunit N
MSSFPIRCFTCGKPISHLWEKYKTQVDDIPEEEEDKTHAIKTILNKLGVGRMCCMRMFMTHVDIDHIQMLYPVHKDNVERLGVADKKPKPKNYTFKNDEEPVEEDPEDEEDVEEELGEAEEAEEAGDYDEGEGDEEEEEDEE